MLPGKFSADTMNSFNKSTKFIYHLSSNSNSLDVNQYIQLSYITLNILNKVCSTKLWLEDLSNRPQVSMGYRLINHAGCW